jgi:hypothetical protein
MNDSSEDFLYYSKRASQNSNDSEIFNRINDFSNKIADSPVILIDKRTVRPKEPQTNSTNSRKNILKNSPSYLMFLMKSLSTRSKANSFVQVKKTGNLNSKIEENQTKENHSSDFETETESIRNRNRENRARIYKRILESLKSDSSFSLDKNPNDSDRSFLDLKIEPDKVNTIRTNHYEKLFESISNNHLKRISNVPISKSSNLFDQLHTDKNIFEDFLRKKNQKSSQLNHNIAKNYSLKSLNSEINTEAIEYIFSTVKNLLFLSILLFIVWPCTILLRAFWLCNKYLSNIFPNLDEVSDQIDRWNHRFNKFEEKILDKITFLS